MLKAIIIIWLVVFSYYIGMERGYKMGVEDDKTSR